MRIKQFINMNPGMYLTLHMRNALCPANDNSPLKIKVGVFNQTLFDIAVHLVRQEYREYTP